MQAFWDNIRVWQPTRSTGEYPDRMAAEAKKKYSRGLDLAVLPETAITGRWRCLGVLGSF
jgi:hypothetical protein